MRISQWTGTLGAAAAIALLAGCSGGSQYAPSATGGPGAGSGTSATSTMHHGAMRTMPMFASRQANDFFNHRPIVNLEQGRVIVDPAKKARCKAKKRGLVFASSNITNDLLVYCGPGKTTMPAGEAAFKTLTGVAGWGVAVHGTSLAVGQSGGTINIYTLPALTVHHSVTLSHQASGYNAYGLSFDNAGGLYATNWPGPYVDYWAPGVTGAPSCTITTTTNTEDYYVDASGTNSVVVYGANANSANFDVDTELVTGMASGCSPISDTFVANFGSFDAGTGFPGGVVSSSGGSTIYVNNQYGTLYNDGAYPGGAVSSSCTWGFSPNDFTNIAMAANQSSIWGSNINFGGATLETYLASFKSGALSGSCATPGAAGGPTAQNANDEFLGVAAYKNNGQ